MCKNKLILVIAALFVAFGLTSKSMCLGVDILKSKKEVVYI